MNAGALSYEPSLYVSIEVAHLFKVVDFPEDGLPTSPIRGSRGMLDINDFWIQSLKSTDTQEMYSQILLLDTQFVPCAVMKLILGQKNL